jgi:diguanylate cyclase (GGDEF)-like protein/PAS domain S-box-containing protein
MKRPFLLVVFVLLLTAATLDFFVQSQLSQRNRTQRTLDTSLRLAALRANIEKEINENLLLVYGMASYLSVNPLASEREFDSYARELMRRPNLLKNFSAAPDFVLTYVYPREGNEAVIGVDYRDLPQQWEQARLAMETGEMVVAGPLELVQGGLGLVGRAPVFEHTPEPRFWGLVSAIIDMDRLFQRVLQEANAADLHLAIRGRDGKGEQGEGFFGDPALFDEDARAVLMSVSIPSGSWQLAAVPERGWHTTPSATPWVHAGIAALFLLSCTGAWFILKNNAEVRRVRQSLAEAQALAHLGSWELRNKGKTLWWSDEAYAIFGVSREAFSPSLEKFLHMVHPEERKAVEEAFATALRERSTYSIEHRIIRPDGEVRHVHEQGRSEYDSQGRPTRSMGTVLDITTHKALEAALRDEEGKLRAMSQASHDAVAMIDSQERILFWNAAAERLFGHTAEEALGRNLHKLIALEKDAHEARQGMPHFARTGQGPVIGTVMEFMARRKDSTIFPVERSVAAFRMHDAWFAVGSLRDITLRKAQEEALESMLERITLASEAGGVGVWEWRVQNGELTWDQHMMELHGITPDEFSGLYEAWRGRLHPEDAENTEQSLLNLLEGESEWHRQFRIILPDGHLRHIQAAARSHRDATGRVDRIVGINQDVTAAKEAQQRLEYMATIDSLTGVCNRRYFLELAQAEMERCRRYPKPFSLIMFDADKFKAVNDTWGHDVGDLVLKAIAHTARQTLREVDILGRLGGEEFAVALPETDGQEALIAAERMRAAMEQQRVMVEHEDIEVRFTMSLGVTTLSDAAYDLEELLKQADQALYKAKENGRNRVELFRA